MQRAALGLAIVLALVGVWLWLRTEPQRGSEPDAGLASATESRSSRETLAPARAAASEPEATPIGAREDAFGTARAPVRGQLVRAADGQPLLERKLLLLASEKNRVSETLTTDEHGAFTSTRAFPRGELRAWVKDSETKSTLTKHAAPFEPEAQGTWLVPVPAPESSEPAEPERVRLVADVDEALVRARVVDLQGRPCANVLVRFVPEQPELVHTRTETDRSGEFEIVLEPGTWRLGGGTPFVRLQPIRLDLAAGNHDLGDLVLPLGSGDAHLAGVVVAPDAEGADAVVFARELASGRESITWTDSFRMQDGEAAFRFDGLPAGRYEVSVVGARAFTPTVLQVEAPCDGLRFVTSDAPMRRFRFEVRGGGDAVDEFEVLGSLRAGWIRVADGRETEVPAVYEQWILLAQGFRPARGRFSLEAPIVEHDFDGTEICLVSVELVPGHGQVLLCLDIEGEGPAWMEAFGLGGAPLPGVELRVNGRTLATSNAQGLLVLDAEQAPERFELRKPGWRLLEQSEEEGIPQKALFARQSP